VPESYTGQFLASLVTPVEIKARRGRPRRPKVAAAA
jgi:hypothetical protein